VDGQRSDRARKVEAVDSQVSPFSGNHCHLPVTTLSRNSSPNPSFRLQLAAFEQLGHVAVPSTVIASAAYAEFVTESAKLPVKPKKSSRE